MDITIEHKTKTVMKKFFFLATVIFLSTVLQAQKNIPIQVVDSITQEPIAGALVALSPKKSFITNNEGFVFILFKNDSESTLVVSSMGYSTKQVEVKKSGDFIIKLSQEKTLMKPIEIKAVRAGHDYPFTQTLISKRELENKNLGQDIPMLLNQVPGVVTNSDAGNGIGYTGIRIRGTDATRINVTLNGIPYNDAESQGVFFVNLPDLLSSTNSIQVQRGVGTSSNGTGAFGATINLLTN